MTQEIEETDFEKKYSNTKAKDEEKNKDKTVLTDDGYALGKLLEDIKVQLFRGNKHGR